MTVSKKSINLAWIVAGVFFTASFLYFALLNRYLMAYQEQIQLFRFDWNYFTAFLAKPGGFAEYIGAFFIQFYLNPVAGALIVTLTGIIAFTLTRSIFRKPGISGILWLLIPALFLFALQSDYMFNPGYIMGLLLVLAFFVLYISIGKDYFRYTFGIIGWIFLYIAAGGFALVATVLCILHELLYSKHQFRLLASAVFAVMAVAIPYLATRTIYFIPVDEAWFDPNLFTFRNITKYTLLLFLVYYPISMFAIKLVPSKGKSWIQPKWSIKTVAAGVIVVMAFSWGVKKYVYDSHIRLFFEIDHNVQQAKWDKVLELSSQSQQTNRLILYYTNLALYKTGHLGDRMFYFNQIGVPGLWLNRDGDKISLFLGGELFYHLGNMNEATRWAYDATLTTGQTPPRLLKQLVLTALVNGDSGVAEKYLNILDQSLYYSDWAKHYRTYVTNPDLILKNPEFAEKRHLMIQNDFVGSTNDSDIGLNQLLENHPDNRMAFEYFMSSLLLSKDLNTFAANIYRIKDLGYKEIPLHYEEALLIYMGMVKKNVVPQGYGIRKTTVQRYQAYGKLYASQSGNPGNAIESFAKSFGNTYWFYLHFIKNRTSANESKHLFN